MGFALLGLNVRDTVLPTADDNVFLHLGKGPAPYMPGTANAVLATVVKRTLCTSWTWRSDSQEVLGSHRSLPHAVDTDGFFPRRVACSWSEKRPFAPAVCRVAATHSPASVAMDKLSALGP